MQFMARMQPARLFARFASSKAGKKRGDTARLYVFTNEKGGMHGFDRDLQLKVIAELSAGSAHEGRALEMDRRTTERIASIKKQLKRRRPQPAPDAAKSLREIEADRDLSRWCAYVDMDMFYAAIELRDKPQFADVPMVVGGSVVATANYVARKLGIRSGMPGFIARELCKRQGGRLLFIKPAMAKYKRESLKIIAALSRHGTVVSQSLDEAKVDVTAAVARKVKKLEKGPPPRAKAGLESEAAEAVVAEMRADIRKSTGLTASAGAGANFLLAKLAAEVNKPDGQFVVPKDAKFIKAWMGRKPVRSIPGVGKVTDRVLQEALCVRTCADAVKNRGLLHHLGAKAAEKIVRASLGISEATLPVPKAVQGSVSAAATFAATGRRDKLEATARRLCGSVAKTMRAKRYKGARGIGLTVKLDDFSLASRQTKVKTPLRSEDDLYKAVMKLLEADWPVSARMLSVKATDFVTAKKAASK